MSDVGVDRSATVQWDLCTVGPYDRSHVTTLTHKHMQSTKTNNKTVKKQKNEQKQYANYTMVMTNIGRQNKEANSVTD